MIELKPIRYAIVNKVRFISFSDVVNVLKSLGAIPKNSGLFYEVLNRLSRDNYYSGVLQVAPYDPFLDWVLFDNIYNVCTENQKRKISETGLLRAIDFNEDYSELTSKFKTHQVRLLMTEIKVPV